jgi:hypothetical protein
MTLDDLALAFEEAKAAEKAANQKRIDIESEILKLVHNQVKEEGRTTFITNGKKIVITKRLIYKTDIDALVQQTVYWDTELRPVKYIVEVDEAKLKKLRATDPKRWHEISNTITTTPAKPNFTLEDTNV